MINPIKNIGGDFSFNSILPFMLKGAELNENKFFPEFLNGKKRVLLETGTDAICYAIISYVNTIDDKIVKIWFPLHYCHATINRVSLTLKHYGVSFSVEYYPEVNADLVNGLGEQDIIVYMHFNKYTRLPGFLLSAKA